MKAFQYRFENILTFREQEKHETEIAYKEAVDQFERVASRLYEQLKKKEETIEEQQQKLVIGFTINEIHHYARFIDSLEKEIEMLQQQVIQARSKMLWFEERLLEKTIEVKKYEKMKEKDRVRHAEKMEHEEALILDELSTIKFSRRENGW